MARIRTIKPEFWGDEKLAPMAAIDRLVFLGLISFADDAGRIVDNVKTIDGFIFPETAESAASSLDSLARDGRILRYRSESGQRLIQVVNWLKHQKVDKPSKYVLPAPEEKPRGPRETLANVSRSDLGPATSDQGPATTDPSSSSGAPVPAVIAVAPGTALLSRTVLSLITAANQGMRDNPAIGEAYNPIPGGHGPSLDAVTQLLNADVPIEFARSHIYAGAKSYVPRGGRDRQITSLRFFTASVIDAWERRQAGELADRGERPAEPAPEAKRRVSARGDDAEAMAVLAKIRNLVVEAGTPGNGAKRFIPRQAVRALGPRADAAYESVGGMQRILGTSPDKQSYLIRDFCVAYTAAGDSGASPSPG